MADESSVGSGVERVGVDVGTVVDLPHVASERLAELLAAASGPAQLHELSWEYEARTVFRSELARWPKARRRKGRTVAVAVAVAAGVLTGSTGLAAATGFPAPAARIVDHMFDSGPAATPTVGSAVPATPKELSQRGHPAQRPTTAPAAFPVHHASVPVCATRAGGTPVAPGSVAASGGPCGNAPVSGPSRSTTSQTQLPDPGSGSPLTTPASASSVGPTVTVVTTTTPGPPALSAAPSSSPTTPTMPADGGSSRGSSQPTGTGTGTGTGSGSATGTGTGSATGTVTGRGGNQGPGSTTGRKKGNGKGHGKGTVSGRGGNRGTGAGLGGSKRSGAGGVGGGHTKRGTGAGRRGAGTQGGRGGAVGG